MPYGKKNYKKGKKSYCSTSTRIGHYATTGSKVVKLAADVYRLKQLINVEFKLKDTALTSTVNNSGTLVLLNGLQKGDGVSNREGVSIRNKSLLLNGYCTIDNAATFGMIRRIIFINRQPTGIAPSIANVLDNSITSYVNAPRNLNNRSDIVILKDDKIMLSNSGNKIAKFPDTYMKLNMHTIYNTGSDLGTVADIQTGALYVLYVSDSSSNNPNINALHRVRYIDN